MTETSSEACTLGRVFLSSSEAVRQLGKLNKHVTRVPL